MRSDLFKHCSAVLSCFSHVRLCVTLCTAAHNRLLCPCGFSRQEYCSGLPCPALGDSQPRDQTCVSCITGRFFTAELPRRPPFQDAVLYLVAYSCLTLCDPMTCSLPESSVHGDSPGKNTGVVYQTLLQEIFPTQGLNLGLLHCRWILYHLSHLGSSLMPSVIIAV